MGGVSTGGERHSGRRSVLLGADLAGARRGRAHGPPGGPLIVQRLVGWSAADGFATAGWRPLGPWSEQGRIRRFGSVQDVPRRDWGASGGPPRWLTA
jgi:hypothetical protein